MDWFRWRDLACPGPAALASVELGASAIVLAAVAPFAGSLVIPLTVRALVSFFWVAIVAGVGAPLLFFALIRERGATQASSLLFVVPAITAVGARVVLGTSLGAAAFAGFAIAGAGLYLTRGAPSFARPRAYASKQAYQQ